MKNGWRVPLGMAVLLALGACSSGAPASDPTVPSSSSPEPSPTPTVRDIAELGDFADLDPGTYFIDPDDDPATPLRVFYDVAAAGWQSWSGAVKFSDDGHVAVSITTIANVTTHACRDHAPADPPVGPSVADLANALADLAPFRVTSPPKDVTIYGYRGKHLELTVPDLPVRGEGDHREFVGCVDGNLASWIATTGPADDAFFGYNADPGGTEEFWILDVEGTRLMIAALVIPGQPAEALVERDAILDSIRIEP